MSKSVDANRALLRFVVLVDDPKSVDKFIATAEEFRAVERITQTSA